MPYQWEAEYFSKGSSKASTCSISVLGDLVLVEVEGQTLRYNLDEIEVSDRLGNIPRKVRLPDEAMVKIEDNPDIDEAFQTSEVNVFIHWLESHMHAVIASIVVMIGFSLLFYFVLLPKSAKYLASVTPQYIKEKIDESVINSLENFSMIEDDRKLLSEYESYSQFVEAQKSRYPHLHLKFRDGVERRGARRAHQHCPRQEEEAHGRRPRPPLGGHRGAARAA
ncbi:MAG: hypothetical protein AAF202_07895, partial [Pseudomonadota bacterium]